MINLWLILTKTARDTLLHLMSKTLFQQVLICTVLVILTGCLHNVDMETGEGCWRYGVAETGNTGRMSITLPLDVPIVYLDMDELAAACGKEVPQLSWTTRGNVPAWGCYRPIENTIYLYNKGGSKRTLTEERCHILLGRNHNA